MKIIRTSGLIVWILICVILSFSYVSGRKGVGIGWDKESVYVDEGSTFCMRYNIYNPWDESVNVTLSLSGEVGDIVSDIESDVIELPAYTWYNISKKVEICFKIPPNIYEKDCVLPGLLCQQKCEGDEKVFSGEVLVMEAPYIGEGMGSSVALGAAAPLRLAVRCVPFGRDWTFLYFLITLGSGCVIGFILYRRRREPKLVREEKKLKKLQDEIKRLKSKEKK